MGPPISTAYGFFQKYGVERYASHGIDQEPSRPGIQNPRVNVSAILHDYQQLTAPHRYAVLSQLLFAEDYDTIRFVLPRAPDHSAPPDSVVSSVLDTLRATLDESASSPTALWQQRLAVVEARAQLADAYHHAQILAGAQAAGGGADPLVAVRALNAHIHESLVNIYTDYWPQRAQHPRGNPLWDTDADLDAFDHLEDWEAAFDHADVLPLQDDCAADTDGDLVCDAYDDRKRDNAVWSTLPIGGVLRGEQYSVLRKDAQTFVIQMKLTVGPDPEGDVATIRRQYLRLPFLQKLKQRIEGEFRSVAQHGAFRFELDLTFQIAPTTTCDIYFAGRETSGDAKHWSIDILTDPMVALHELGHAVLDYPDFYHEPIVSGGVRDQALKPGYDVLGAAHLMGGGAILPYVDLLNIVAKPDGDDSRSIGGSLPVELQFGYAELGKDRTRLKGLSVAASLELRVTTDPLQADALRLRIALYRLLLGEKRTALTSLKKLMRKHPGDTHLLYNVVAILDHLNQMDAALPFTEQLRRVPDYSLGSRWHAEALLSRGWSHEALGVIKGALSSDDGTSRSALEELHAVALIQAGQIQGAVEHLRSLQSKDPMDSTLKLLVAVALTAEGKPEQSRAAFQTYLDEYRLEEESALSIDWDDRTKSIAKLLRQTHTTSAFLRTLGHKAAVSQGRVPALLRGLIRKTLDTAVPPSAPVPEAQDPAKTQ